MDFHKKETQKYLIPIGLALAGFIVAVISILFGYFYLPNLGAAFFLPDSGVRAAGDFAAHVSEQVRRQNRAARSW